MTGGSQGSPKSSPTPGPSVKWRDIRVVIAWLIFTVALLATIVVYGLNVRLSGFDFLGIKFNGQIQNIGEKIAAQEDAIQTSTIEEVILFDKQIATVKDLTVSKGGYEPLIDVLSSVILDSVQFESASFDLNGDTYTVSVSAVANNLYAYLQQLAVINNSDNPLVQKIQLGGYNIQRGESGESTVAFSLGMTMTAAELTGGNQPLNPIIDDNSDIPIPEDSQDPFEYEVEGGIEIPEL